MIRAFLFAAVFLILSSARITIPIKQHQLPATVTNELNKHTAQAFLAAEASASDYYHLDLTMRNARNIYYSGDIFVGKDNKAFSVLFDSGSNLLWLPTTKCFGCPAKTKYVCESSATCIETLEFKQLQYGLGYVSGGMGYEMIGMTKDFQVNASLLWANNGQDLENYQDMDGFMGFGNMESTNDFVDLAYKNNFIQDKVFTFYLDHNPSLDSASSGSYLAIGYLPEDKVNKVTWVSVTNPTRWSTRVYSMKVGDVSTSTSISTASAEVLFDTGCSFNYLNTAFVTELTKQLSSMESVDFLANKFYRCDAEYLYNYPNLTVGLYNMELTLNVYNYLYFTAPLQRWNKNYCQLAIKESTFGLQILGDAFLKNNFVAFSKRNQSMGIYQEYRPVVLPPASNNFYMVLIMLVIAALAALIIFRKNDKRVQKLNTFLKNEGGNPDDGVTI